jgi:hypothetical protein
MKWLWTHRYSLLSIGFSFANFVFIFGALNNWFWMGPVVPHTELARRVLAVHSAVAIASMGLAGLGAAKERPRTFGFVALAVSWLSFFISGMSMAV